MEMQSMQSMSELVSHSFICTKRPSSWRRNVVRDLVFQWPGPGRRACYRGTVSWKPTRGINQQNEKEEASWGCSSLHIVANPCNGPWLFPGEDEVRAGVRCRHTWEPELVSPFHHDRSWTILCFVFVCGGGLFCCLFVVLLSMTFP